MRWAGQFIITCILQKKKRSLQKLQACHQAPDYMRHRGAEDGVPNAQHRTPFAISNPTGKLRSTLSYTFTEMTRKASFRC